MGERSDSLVIVAGQDLTAKRNTPLRLRQLFIDQLIALRAIDQLRVPPIPSQVVAELNDRARK